MAATRNKEQCADHARFGSGAAGVEKGPDDRGGGNAIMHERLVCALRAWLCGCVVMRIKSVRVRVCVRVRT